MRKWLFALTLCTASLAADSPDVSQLSRMLGHLIGSNLDAPGFSFEIEEIIIGMRSAAEGQEPPMSMEAYTAGIEQLTSNDLNSLAASNLKEAEQFLTANRAQPGIEAVADGQVQYRVQHAGSGRTVSSESTPLLHYTATFADGSQLGSSIGSDPVALSLQETVPGFAAGVVGMTEGEKRTVYVHPDQGYGKNPQFPPNALLVFEVEIIKADTQ